MTLDGLRKYLRRECDKVGSQKGWAAQHGLSLPYVNDVINGRREPGESILAALGYERAPVSYRKKDTTDG